MNRGLMLTSLVLLAGSALAQPGEVIPHEFTVRLVEEERIDDIAESYGAVVVAGYPSRRVYLLRVTEFDDDDEAEQELEGDDRLEWADRNRVNAIAGGHTQSFFVQAVPSTFFDQPAWPAIGLPAPSPNPPPWRVVVAVLDTGVYPHPLYEGAVLADGANFIDGEPPTMDQPAGQDTNGNGRPDELAGHGSFIAGLITHIAPGADILPVRVLDSDGVGTSFSVAAGIYYAIDHRAAVINLSLATTTDTVTLREAVKAATDLGISVVCAAGGSEAGGPTYPAAIPGATAVCSIGYDDRLSPRSGSGGFVTFAAPGEGVVSTFPPDQFAQADGTSVSAALVSGAVARKCCQSPMTRGASAMKVLRPGARPIDGANPGLSGLVGRALVVEPAPVRPPRVMKAR